MIPIYENYKVLVPPAWVKKSVERLLASLSDQHVNGLESIVLTDSGAVGKGKTQRVSGRKYHRRECRGTYHYAWKGRKPWIEIIVDQTIAGLPRAASWSHFVQDIYVGDALFHEVGHHLDATIGSAAHGHEAAAEDWRVRLWAIHRRKRYRHLLILSFLLRSVYAGVLALKRSLVRFVSGRPAN